MKSEGSESRASGPRPGASARAPSATLRRGWAGGPEASGSGAERPWRARVNLVERRSLLLTRAGAGRGLDAPRPSPADPRVTLHDLPRFVFLLS